MEDEAFNCPKCGVKGIRIRFFDDDAEATAYVRKLLEQHQKGPEFILKVTGGDGKMDRIKFTKDSQISFAE